MKNPRKNNRRNMHLGAKASTFRNAWKLRRAPTPAEIKLWECLRDRQMEGAKFRQQHPCVNVVFDFYSNALKYVIEVDGDIHLEPDQIKMDEEKNKLAKERNLELQRFTNNEVLNSIEDVLARIRQKVMELRVRKARG
jgi:very-short-patch-repair endonuclease